MVIGMFMAILDIQIVSASMSEIQAGLPPVPMRSRGSRPRYLIAEVVMIPLSGLPQPDAVDAHAVCRFRGRLHGGQRARCATATNIDQLIVYRAIQGFIGGGDDPQRHCRCLHPVRPSHRSMV